MQKMKGKSIIMLFAMSLIVSLVLTTNAFAKEYEIWEKTLPECESNYEWTVKFNKVISENSVTQESVYILDENHDKLVFINPRVINTGEEGKIILEFSKSFPGQEFEKGKKYTIVIENTVSAQNGEKLVRGIRAPFQVRAGADLYVEVQKNPRTYPARIGDTITVNVSLSDGQVVEDGLYYSVSVYNPPDESGLNRSFLGSIYNLQKTFIIPKTFTNLAGQEISLIGKEIYALVNLGEDSGLGKIGIVEERDENIDTRIRSTIGSVDCEACIIELANDTSLEALKSAITVISGGTFEVYKSDGIRIATDLGPGDLLVVIAKDGKTEQVYTINFQNMDDWEPGDEDSVSIEDVDIDIETLSAVAGRLRIGDQITIKEVRLTNGELAGDCAKISLYITNENGENGVIDDLPNIFKIPASFVDYTGQEVSMAGGGHVQITVSVGTSSWSSSYFIEEDYSR